NGYTVGRRSLAVSSGLLELFLARRLGPDQIVAVLVHELGHHATGATRYTPASSWLAAPWRIASRLMIGITLAILSRRQPKPLLALVFAVAVVRGVQQLISQHQWAPALLLATTAAGAVVCPLADAALSRSCEYAADRYAADRGAGSQLTAALRAVERRSGRRGWAGRALATHPGTDRRVEALSRHRQAAGRR
ncbi:MAG: M48 family metalloprotease, partial [Mycobacteriales bacterium]